MTRELGTQTEAEMQRPSAARSELVSFLLSYGVVADSEPWDQPWWLNSPEERGASWSPLSCQARSHRSLAALVWCTFLKAIKS